jgi:methanogenic corrinoid protein MtbC1
VDQEIASLVARAEQALLAVDLLLAREALAGAAAVLGARGALEAVLVPALDRVGERWDAGEASLSQVYMAGRYAEVLSDQLLPLEAPPADALRIGLAVLEDQHLLGKRMVMAHLRAAGLSPLDLGDGVSAALLAARAIAARVEVLLVSTLMLRAALAVKDLVALLRAGGSAARVVVGGAPFRLDPSLWRSTGADACGRVAADAPRLALALGRPA